MQIINSEIKKILCIKPRGIGDVVLSTIVLENLRAHFTNAKIDFLTEDFVKPSIDGIPLISKVLTMRKSEFPLKVANRIRKEKYDLIFDFWSNPRSALITFLSFTEYRVGFNYRGRSFAYNFKVDVGRGEHHSAEHNLELLKALDVKIISKNIYAFVDNKKNEWAENFISDNFSNDTPVIGIIPSGGWESKRCDAEKWVEICKLLKKELDIQLMIIWGPGDELDAQLISNGLPDSTFLSPKTSISEMSALINNCSLIIANDSGPMHISAALGIPTLGLFGPTDPKKHGPYSENSNYVIKSDLHCIICNKLTCPYNHECMKELPIDEVLMKAKNMLNIIPEIDEKY